MAVKNAVTFPVRAGMFMELVAKPIPKAMDASTPRNLATSCSTSSWMSRFPEKNTVPRFVTALKLRRDEQEGRSHSSGLQQLRAVSLRSRLSWLNQHGPLRRRRSGHRERPQTPGLSPISERVLLTPAPYFFVHSTAASAQAPVFSAKPR